MTLNTKERFEQINDVSRQLLSRILIIQTSLQATKTEPTSEDNIDSPTDKELMALMSKRQILVTHLFEQNTAAEISSQTVLLQEMLTLDDQLTTKSALCKQAIAEQVIKIKKSKKITSSYQKY